MNDEAPCLRHVAIVGGGPRGLASLESLLSVVARRAPSWSLRVTLFEREALPGSGPNFGPTRFEGWWLNLPERLVDIPARPAIALQGISVSGFPDYLTWANWCDSAIDRFPARAKLGRYLAERFDSLALPLQQADVLSLIRHEVRSVRPSAAGDGYNIECEIGTLPAFEEVLLTIGHQVTHDDESLALWRNHVASHPSLRLVDRPYDDEDWVHDDCLADAGVVALRGMGLSMIDVVSLLTEGRGGVFHRVNEHDQSMRYEASGDEPTRLVPFSLDGLPLAAKPLNSDIDESFKPLDGEMHEFRQRCQAIVATDGGIDEVRTQLSQAVASVQAEVYLRFSASDETSDDFDESRQQWQTLALQWIDDEELEHESLTDLSVPTIDIMQAWVAMACGQRVPSFDYCLGQVWRHLQRILFDEFSCSSLPDDAMQWIAALHERFKRYSYGPPVGSLQRLIALHEAGRVTFVVADDPDIEMTDAGWILEHQGDRVCANVMIDTVLASPAIARVNEPLVRQLLDDGLLTPFAEDLGAVVNGDGLVVTGFDGKTADGLALIGRLAKGRVIGVDSIVESFGARPQRWAEAAVERLQTRD